MNVTVLLNLGSVLTRRLERAAGQEPGTVSDYVTSLVRAELSERADLDDPVFPLGAFVSALVKGEQYYGTVAASPVTEKGGLHTVQLTAASRVRWRVKSPTQSEYLFAHADSLTIL